MKHYNLLANTGSQLAVVASGTLSDEVVDYVVAKGWQLSVEDGQNALYVAVRLSEVVALLTQEAVDETVRLNLAYNSSAEVDRRELNPDKAAAAARAADELAGLSALMSRHHATVVQTVTPV